eukprot:gene20404-27282_t
MHNRVQRSGPTTTATTTTATVPTPPSALVSSTSTALSATSSRYSLRTSVTPVFDPSYSWSEKHTQGAGPRTAAIKPTPSPSPDHTTATTTRANPRRTARRKSTTHPQSFPFSRKSASTARPFAIKMTSKCNNFLPALFRMCNNDDEDHRENVQRVYKSATPLVACLLGAPAISNDGGGMFAAGCCITWADDGCSFWVSNIEQFARDILPIYYKHNNYASFVRQLNMYGFHRSTEPKGKVEPGVQMVEHFTQEYFRRGQEHLLKNIHRKTSKMASKSKA